MIMEHIDDGMKLETKYYKLERLLKWVHVEEVNDMLLSGISPHKVEDWCREHGFSISHPKLYEYRTLLRKAAMKKIPVATLLGVGVPTPSLEDMVEKKLTNKSVANMTNDLDVLDMIIQKGFMSLTTDHNIKLQDALRAIEMKNKMTGGSNNLSAQMLTQIKEVEEAKFNVVVEIVKKYVPEDKIEELLLAIENAEKEYYATCAPELLEEYEKNSK